jgi:hypothetical protein
MHRSLDWFVIADMILNSAGYVGVIVSEFSSEGNTAAKNSILWSFSSHGNASVIVTGTSDKPIHAGRILL